MAAQKPLLCAHAREERRQHAGGKEHAHTGTKGEAPPQRADEQSQIAGMADAAVDAGRNQLVPGLYGNKTAEAMAEHEYRPHPHRAARSEQSNANPAHPISVDGPELVAIRVGRQPRAQQPEQTENRQYPAVRAILPLARAEVAAAEGRNGAPQ